MKSYAKILSALSATVLTVPLLVSFGSAANAATAPQSLPPEVCNSIDLTGTWAPNYVFNHPDQNGSSGTYDSWQQSDSEIKQMDRVQITQTGCKLTVLDVKNNESWYVDMSGRSLMFVPTTLVARFSRANIYKINAFEFSLLKSARAETMPHLSKDGKNLSGLDFNVYATVPRTSSNPFSVDFKLGYELSFQADSSVYSSSSYQRTGQLPANVPIKSIELVSSTWMTDFSQSNLTILGATSPYLPGPMAKAFVWGANWLIQTLNKTGEPLSILPETLYSNGGGTGGNDGLTIIRVSDKLL